MNLNHHGHCGHHGLSGQWGNRKRKIVKKNHPDRENDNQEALELKKELEASHNPEKPLVTSLKKEKEINTFFRLSSPTVISKLKEAFTDISDQPSPKEVFLKLRELRNSW